MRRAVVLALALAACAPDFRDASRVLARDMPAAREPLAERRRSFYDSGGTQLRREWHVLIGADNSTVAHGRDEGFYRDGKPEYAREFDHGEPTGRWRTWWSNGNPRMEAVYGTREPQPMRWWHDDGALSSEGPAVDGLKEGEWSFFHRNGVKAAQGRYAGGAREGTWSFWNEDGTLAEQGQYRRDARVGDWTRG